MISSSSDQCGDDDSNTPTPYPATLSFHTCYSYAFLEGASSQFVMARLNRTELLLSPGLLNLSEESGGAVVWGWQNYSATANPEVTIIVAMVELTTELELSRRLSFETIKTCVQIKLCGPQYSAALRKCVASCSSFVVSE